MSWTYSGNPADSDLDEVRFLLGEKSESAQSLSDEEVLYIIGLNVDENYNSAAECADIMAVRFTGLSASSKSVGDLTISNDYAGTANRWAELACKLRKGRTMYNPGAPVMADTSLNVFSIGMHDSGYVNPRLL